jgi:hypothetical protein
VVTNDSAPSSIQAGVGSVYLNQRALPNFVAPLLVANPELSAPPSWAEAAGLGERALPHLWLGAGKVVAWGDTVILAENDSNDQQDYFVNPSGNDSQWQSTAL